MTSSSSSPRTQAPRAERPGMLRTFSKSFSLLPALVLLMIAANSVTAAGLQCQKDADCRRNVCIMSACAPRPTTGGTCSLDTHCFNAATESCINNKCLARSSTGGPCDGATDCAKAGDTCNGGKCESPFVPSLMVWDGNQSPLNPSGNSPSVVVNDILFVFEGQGSSTPLSVEAYDSVTKTWTSKAPAPVNCDYPSTVAVGTSIFLIGGVKSGSALTTFYRYDTVSNTWETDWTQLPSALYLAGVAAVGNTVFLFGGFAGSTRLDTILSIDVSSKGKSWTTYANAKLPTPTSDLSATTVGTDIYLTGGSAGVGAQVSTALKYNTNSPNVSPTSIGSMNQARGGHMSFYDLTNTLLYVVGVGSQIQNAVEVLDLSPSSSGAWSPVDAPNYAPTLSISGGLIGSRFHFASAQTLQVLDVTSPSSVKWNPFANSPSPDATIVQMTGPTKITAVDPPSQKTSFYDIASNTWTTGPACPIFSKNTASAVINQEVFVMGGTLGAASSSPAVYKLNTAGDTWIQQDSLPSAKLGGCATASGANIFFYGGAARTYSNPTSDLYLMDTTKAKDSGQWSTIDPGSATPAPVMDCAAVVVGQKLLIFGGRTTSSGTSSTGLIQSFDIASNKWDAPITATITARSSLSAVFLKGFVFLIGGTADGGSTTLSKTEVFDVTTQKVSAIKDMPTPRFALGSVTDGTSVFSVGGQTMSGFSFPSLEKLHTP